MPNGENPSGNSRGDRYAIAAKNHAASYNKSAESRAFFEFTRVMSAYEDMIDQDTPLLMSTDSEMFTYFKGIETSSVKPDDKARP